MPARRLFRPRVVCCSINLLCTRSFCFRVGGTARGGTPALPDDVTGASGRRGSGGCGIASLVRAAGPGAMAALGGDGLRLLSVSRPERQPESAALGGPGPGLCCWVSVFSCLSLACSYVGSLYVWKSELPRCGGCARGRNPRFREAGLWAELGRTGGGAALPRGGCGSPELTAPSVGTTLPSSSGASLASWWCPVSRLSACYSGESSQASRCEGGGAEGKAGRISRVFRGERAKLMPPFLWLSQAHPCSR